MAQYMPFGTEPGSVSPDGYSLDIFYTQRPEYAEIQADLLFDYQNNVKLYPAFQEYLRKEQPPLLAVLGEERSILYPRWGAGFPAGSAPGRHQTGEQRPFCPGILL